MVWIVELARHLVRKYVRGINGSTAQLLFEVFNKRVKQDVKVEPVVARLALLFQPSGCNSS